MAESFRLEGKLVNLRTAIPDDLDDYARWDNPDLEAWKYDGPWYGRESLRGVIEVRKKWLAGPRTPPYRFLEIETKDGAHIGWVVVSHADNDPHMTGVGVGIYDDQYWDKGLGTEVLYLWVDYLFRALGLSRIGYRTWSGNKRAIAIGLKLGFVEEGRIRRGCEVDGAFHDRIFMGILREEWDRSRETFTP